MYTLVFMFLRGTIHCFELGLSLNSLKQKKKY